MTDKLCVIQYSGAVDKLMAMSTIVAGATAMQKEVHVFLTFGGIGAFRKGAPETNQQFSTEMAPMAGMILDLAASGKVPHWHQVIRQAKEIGEVKVHACGMTMDLFRLTQADMDAVVDDVQGVASFLELSEGAQLLFIS